ncbi:hexose transporter [Hyaloscypha variabilis]
MGCPNSPLVVANAFSRVNSNCHPVWYKDSGLRTLNFLLLGPMLSSVGFGYDAVMISGLLANNMWFKDLHVPSTTVLGAIIAANSFGAVVCLFPVSDKPWGFIGTRVILGFVGTGVKVASSILVAELAHPRQRAPITSLWFTFFYVRGITNSWTWRLPVMLQALWNVIQLPILLLCPESPRWLAMKGRNDEAKQILAKYHANGDLDDELVNLEYNEILETIAADTNRESNSWLAMIKPKSNTRRTILVIFIGLSTQWVGNGIVSYYFAPILETVGITSEKQQQGINGGLQIFNWLMAIAGALFSERLGRKTLLPASAIGMLISMILVTALSAVYSKNESAATGKAVIVFLFLFFGSYDIGFTPIPPLYVAEIAPSSIRANYVSLYWLTTAVALSFNQFVNPIALAAIAWRYYFVYIAVLVVVIFILALFAPETKGLTLEEVQGLFDDDAAEVTLHAVELAKQQHKESEKEQAWVETKENVSA